MRRALSGVGTDSLYGCPFGPPTRYKLDRKGWSNRFRKSPSIVSSRKREGVRTKTKEGKSPQLDYSESETFEPES